MAGPDILIELLHPKETSAPRVPVEIRVAVYARRWAVIRKRARNIPHFDIRKAGSLPTSMSIFQPAPGEMTVDGAPGAQ